MAATVISRVLDDLSTRTCPLKAPHTDWFVLGVHMAATVISHVMDDCQPLHVTKSNTSELAFPISIGFPVLLVSWHITMYAL